LLNTIYRIGRMNRIRNLHPHRPSIDYFNPVDPFVLNMIYRIGRMDRIQHSWLPSIAAHFNPVDPFVLNMIYRIGRMDRI